MFDINFGMKKISMELIREWAHEASQAYLSSGIEPGFTIEKIASSEDLVPHQIQTLCAETNKLLHTQKYASETDKYHAANFPHADAAGIISKLQISDTVKVGGLDSFKPDVSEDLSFEHFFGIESGEQGQFKTASLKQEVHLKIEKLEDFEKKASLDYIEKTSAQVSAENTFIKQALQMINVDDNETQRLDTIGQIFVFSKQAGFESKAKELLTKVAHIVNMSGLISKQNLDEVSNFFMSKEADCKAPQSLISEKLLGHVQIVNGDHPLYITLQTINKAEAEAMKSREYALIAQDNLKILKQKIRAL
jgi:hypothetical protein